MTTRTRHLAVLTLLSLSVVGCAVEEDDAATSEDALEAAPSAIIASQSIETGSPRCLQQFVVGPKYQTRVVLGLVACTDGAEQHWKATSDGQIRDASTRCLTVVASAAEGDRLTVDKCRGNEDQRFRLVQDGTIRSRGTGLCLEVVGAMVDARSCTAGKAQQFSFPGAASIPWCFVAPTPSYATPLDYVRAMTAPLEIYRAPRPCGTCGATGAIPSDVGALARRIEGLRDVEVTLLESASPTYRSYWLDLVMLRLYKTLHDPQGYIPWPELSMRYPKTRALLAWLGSVPEEQSPYARLATELLAMPAHERARLDANGVFMKPLPGDSAAAVRKAVLGPVVTGNCCSSSAPLTAAQMRTTLAAVGLTKQKLGTEWNRVLDVLAEGTGACGNDVDLWLDGRGPLDRSAVNGVHMRLAKVERACAPVNGRFTCVGGSAPSQR